MKRLFYLSALALIFSIQGAKVDPFEGPQPIAVLIQSNPWAMVLGSDTPRVVLYEDGTIIFVKESEEKAEYHFKKLEAPEIRRIKDALAPIAKVPTNSYVLTRATDQPEAEFYVRLDGRETALRIYGLREPEDKPRDLGGRVDRSTFPPAEAFEAHRFLCSLDYADSLPWKPKFIEAMIWPYEYAPEQSILWPKDWPDLKSE